MIPRDGSKLAQVIELLRRADGATIADLSQATGWLPHTTRATLTGLRKRGYAVIRERIGAGDIGAGDSVYRISDAPAHRMKIVPSSRTTRWMAAGPSGRRRKRRVAHDPGAAGGETSYGGEVRSFACARRRGSGRSLPILRVLILMGYASNGAPIWAAKRLPILMKVLAYRLQSDGFGDFDKSIRRILRSGKEDGVGAASSAARLRRARAWV